MDQQDKESLHRYRAGDVAALGELVEQYRKPLYGFILRMTEGRDEAEDIFQEVWIRAIRHLDQFKEKRLLSWLFRITHNLIIDRARKKKPDQSLQEETSTGETRQDVLAAPDPSPARLLANQDMAAHIQQAIRNLPEDQRSVFLMRMDGDLSFKEISRIQQIPLNTALTRMRYAVEKLRKELQDDYREWTRC
jgi:RNA polymerase sigma-70 factor, ECF subfamily